MKFDTDRAGTTVRRLTDLARGLARLGAEGDVGGEEWHLPAAPTLSHREPAAIAYEEAGFPQRIRSSRVAALAVEIIGRFQRDVGEVAELLYQFRRPHVVDHGKYEASFGAEVTPHRQAVRATLDWYRDNAV